jgi:hypothetical protein
MGSFVVTALLWAVALAATIWILVPAIAFAFGAGGVRSEVLPDVGPPPLPGDDPSAQPLLAELAALGFQAAGRTVQRARFITPTHWSWRQHGSTLWLVSPDRRSYATLYRLVDGEPLRISLLTLFDNGGMVRTSSPGGAAPSAWRPNHWCLDLRGVDTRTLVARHQEQIEAFAGEDAGVRARAATVAEIAAVDDAFGRTIGRKMGASGYGIVFAFVPALMFVIPGVSGQMRSSFAALGVCAMAGFYALLRWAVHGPLLRYNARRSHVENLGGQPDDVAPDGRILATGPHERRIRTLAVASALVACWWPIVLTVRIPITWALYGPGGVALRMLFIALTVLGVVQLVGRARGRIWWRPNGQRDPVNIWTWWILFNVVFPNWTDWSKGPIYRAVDVMAALMILLGLAGWQLEKKRGLTSGRGVIARDG